MIYKQGNNGIRVESAAETVNVSWSNTIMVNGPEFDVKMAFDFEEPLSMSYPAYRVREKLCS